jgi:hypothetical protein
MSTANPQCGHARLHIGADPRHLAAEVQAHVESCDQCRRFRDETLALDARLQAALELPLPDFRQRAATPRRWYALAASIVLGLLLAGGAWLFRPPMALAGELVQHVAHEAGSWEQRRQVPAAEVADVLRQAGVRFDPTLPVVYAMACPFHGRLMPHFVVQTDHGPMTVMLLPDEKVRVRTRFTEGGYHGVLLPAGEGSVAVLSREGAVPDSVAGQVISGVHW